MKRMAAGGLFLNADHHLLIVKPIYREGWQVPGGIVNADESPLTACRREVREELGIDVDLGRLLCIEYRCTAPPETEALQFIFFGGILSADQIGRITLQQKELTEFCFVTASEAMKKLYTQLGERVQLALIALRENRTVYAENGIEKVAL
jgi:8-oxo-dGTP diphosphatase